MTLRMKNLTCHASHAYNNQSNVGLPKPSMHNKILKGQFLIVVINSTMRRTKIHSARITTVMFVSGDGCNCHDTHWRHDYHSREDAKACKYDVAVLWLL